MRLTVTQAVVSGPHLKVLTSRKRKLYKTTPLIRRREVSTTVEQTIPSLGKRRQLSKFSSVRNTLQRNVLRSCRPAARAGFFSPRRSCPLETEDERKWHGRLFQMTGAATLKLRLSSSVAAVGTTRSPRFTERRPERFAVGMRRRAGRTGTSGTVYGMRSASNCCLYDAGVFVAPIVYCCS